jgi:hypothetical protein
VYGNAGGDVRPTGVSWDGQELWPDELFELFDVLRDDGTWRAQDGARLHLYGNDDEEGRQRFVTAVMRQFQADGMRVVPPRWPEVSLHGEMVVWSMTC